MRPVSHSLLPSTRYRPTKVDLPTPTVHQEMYECMALSTMDLNSSLRLSILGRKEVHLPSSYHHGSLKIFRKNYTQSYFPKKIMTPSSIHTYPCPHKIIKLLTVRSVIMFSKNKCLCSTCLNTVNKTFKTTSPSDSSFVYILHLYLVLLYPLNS